MGRHASDPFSKAPGISRRIWRVGLWACGLALGLVVAGFVCISLWIGADVRATCKTAMAQYAGDAVEALLSYVQDDRHTLRERNRAVWALGQLGDERALPLLRNYYSGEPCDHRSALCQRELAKAIELLDGGLNATALVWRHPPKR